jgi:hypothetical protein
MAQELETLVVWIRQQMPALLESKEPWQVVLHGGRGGDVIAEVIRKQAVLPPKKDRAVGSGAASGNGHLR